MKDDVPTDTKRKLILKASFAAFATYGYRRTSMADIAREAGISRPSLYMHFSGKEDIFRALAQFYYDDSVSEVERALTLDGAPDKVLEHAFLAQYGSIGETLLTSLHGEELMDTGHAVGADIAAEGEARLAEVYAAWLEREAVAERIRLSVPAPHFAQLIVMSLKGIKAPPHKDFLRRLRTLAQVFGRGLAR